MNVAVSHPKTRLKVAVDVDEVLGRFLKSLNAFYLEKHGKSYTEADYFDYDQFAKVWQCSPEAAMVIVHDFFESTHFTDGIDVITGSRQGLEQLAQICDMVIVTSRQHIIEGITRAWLSERFGGLFQEVYFGNVHSAGTSRKKSDMCREAGATVLIDDNPRYARDCAAAGIHTLLFDLDGGYPWSKLPPGDERDNITVVHNWEQVVTVVSELANKHGQP